MQDVESLRAAVAAGARPGFLPFYGHRPVAGVAAGPWLLSQWFPAPFTVAGVRYPTAEHWMMAGKARVFGDDEALARILASDDPADAKRAGREVRGFVTGTWAERRFDVVVAGTRAKFGTDLLLGDYLRSTGDAVLVEASPADRVWGVGLGVDDPDVLAPHRWRGANLLGFALMRVRDELS